MPAIVKPRLYFLTPYAKQRDQYQEYCEYCPQSAGIDRCCEKISPDSSRAPECCNEKRGPELYVLLADMRDKREQRHGDIREQSHALGFMLRQGEEKRKAGYQHNASAKPHAAHYAEYYAKDYIEYQNSSLTPEASISSVNIRLSSFTFTLDRKNAPASPPATAPPQR